MNVETKSKRLFPLDALRGLIMVVMALDHANHFVAQKHSSGEYWGGPFPAYTDALAFLTRFVTHIAAPGFFFLMGVGMLLFAASRSDEPKRAGAHSDMSERAGAGNRQVWSRWKVLRHFWIRGILLMVLQLLIVNRAWELLSAGGWGLEFYIGVLFALGGCMILGSLFLWLKPAYLLALAAALFIAMQLLAPEPSQWGTLSANPANLLLARPGGSQQFWSNYPILPWLPLVIFGMFFAHWLREEPQKAYRRGLALGGLFLLAFLVLRYLDGFGNIRPRAGDAWINWLNVVKYPPSWTFALLTMGVNLILLWLFAQANDVARRFFRPLVVFGQTPLFFYILHLFLYGALGMWLAPDGGTSILVMFAYWILGLLILYPLCLWYGDFKHQQGPDSIWRFF